jgi:hypothetical protein
LGFSIGGINWDSLLAEVDFLPISANKFLNSNFQFHLIKGATESPFRSLFIDTPKGGLIEKFQLSKPGKSILISSKKRENYRKVSKRKGALKGN